MARTIFFSIAILACVPLFALGQTSKGATQSTVPCCGQTVAKEQTLEEVKLETQLNLQGILLQRTAAKRLVQGDYLIAENPGGYEFRALVSRYGIVDGWYLADLDGEPIALINATGGSSPYGDVRDCFALYSRELSNCAYLKNWPNRYQLCIDNAWSMLMNCWKGQASGPVMR